METYDVKFALKQRIMDLEQDKNDISRECDALRDDLNALKKLLGKAISFTAGYDDKDFQITIENRSDGRWAVVQIGQVLNKSGEWEYEPLSSRRSEEFLERTRFSFEEAWRMSKNVIFSEERVMKKPKMIDNVIEDKDGKKT